MRYHILATDYDGTIAHNEIVDAATLDQLKKLKLSNRKIILVTGREIRDLERVFPEYKVFDHIVAENGALLLHTTTGEETLLGPAPDPAFIQALEDAGVTPLSVGKVIVATWEPHQNTVLDIIKQHGLERQVIFNKGAVMILPPGLNKATGLDALLQSLHLSMHNTVAIGDAENDSAMFQVAECAVAVSNALPSLKETVDYITRSDHGKGVGELIEELIADDMQKVQDKLVRHYLSFGNILDSGKPYELSPYRPGMLLSGVSGGGKTTLTLSILESMSKKNYQFCLIDPEGDYLELPGAVVIGNEKKLPSLEEIAALLLPATQSVVICMLSIPLAERPIFFSGLMNALIALRNDYGHPHWIVADEAHHLVPEGVNTATYNHLNNYILISTAPDTISKEMLAPIKTVITVGDNTSYPFEQFAKVVNIKPPASVPDLQKGQCCVWNMGETPFIVEVNKPAQLQQRHKKKYAQGDMGDNSFIFTGSENKLQLKANNLMMFVHIAEGIDDDTWQFHLENGDYSKWFGNTVHDDELAETASDEESKQADPQASRKAIIDHINKKYTG